jgi:hypothetical protein
MILAGDATKLNQHDDSITGWVFEGEKADIRRSASVSLFKGCAPQDQTFLVKHIEQKKSDHKHCEDVTPQTSWWSYPTTSTITSGSAINGTYHLCQRRTLHAASQDI